MSGILRSSLCLVGTTKCAAHDSIRYLRTMVPPNNNLNRLLALNSQHYRLYDTQANKANIKSNSFWKTFRASVNKIIPIFAEKLPDKEETLVSRLGNFIASQSSGKIFLRTKDRAEKNFTFPTVFMTELNGKFVEPKLLLDTVAAAEEEPISFRAGGLNLLLDGNKLKFKVEDSDETFILHHAVYVKAYNKPPQIEKNRGLEYMPLNIRDRFLCDAKLTIETPLKEKEDHFYKFDHVMASLDAFDALGDHETIVKPKKTTKPEFDEPGRVQLQFPMALSLQGFKQVIEIAPSNETFIIYHNVSFEAFKEPSKNNVIANTKNDKKTNIGRIEMLLQTGDCELTTLDPSNPSFDCRHEVSILVDLDGDVPLIEMNPKTIQKHMHR